MKLRRSPHLIRVRGDWCKWNFVLLKPKSDISANTASSHRGQMSTTTRGFSLSGEALTIGPVPEFVS